MPRVICTSLNAEHGPHFEILRDAGFDVDVIPRDRSVFDAQQLLEMVGGANAIVAGAEPYSASVIESLAGLRVIARTGVGFDAIDLQACDRAGVVVTTTPGVNHHAVAEHTIALLMGVSRGFPDQDQRVRQQLWKRVAHPRVMGRTLGIVGLGRIGKAVATRAAGLGLKLIAHELYPDDAFVKQWGIRLVELEELWDLSDIVSLHLPMSADNHHMINADTLARMRPGSILINTARGKLVDEQALYEALQSGHLQGAGLDVFDTEPLPLESPLIGLSNVLLAGHVAGLDVESHNDTFAMAARTVIALQAGEWPADCIQNLKDCDGWSWNQNA